MKVNPGKIIETLISPIKNPRQVYEDMYSQKVKSCKTFFVKISK